VLEFAVVVLDAPGIFASRTSSGIGASPGRSDSQKRVGPSRPSGHSAGHTFVRKREVIGARELSRQVTPLKAAPSGGRCQVRHRHQAAAGNGAPAGGRCRTRPVRRVRLVRLDGDIAADADHVRVFPLGRVGAEVGILAVAGTGHHDRRHQLSSRPGHPGRPAATSPDTRHPLLQAGNGGAEVVVVDRVSD
jgi:hypothetical protein